MEGEDSTYIDPGLTPEEYPTVSNNSIYRRRRRDTPKPVQGTGNDFEV